jgi:hypothetical protein
VESSVANLTEYRASILSKAWAAAARSPHNSGVTTKGNFIDYIKGEGDHNRLNNRTVNVRICQIQCEKLAMDSPSSNLTLTEATPSLEQGYKHVHGYHLTSEGLYWETFTAMCMRNPNIRWGHKEYARTLNECGRTSVLELCGDHPLHAVRKDFENSQDLCKYLKVNTQPSFRRVIILEGVARNYVEVLRSHFNMDPAFFSNQKRPNSWDIVPKSYCIERTANLPSLNDPKNLS